HPGSEVDLANDAVPRVGDIEGAVAVEREAARKPEVHPHAARIREGEVERGHGQRGEIDLADGEEVRDVEVAIAVRGDARGKEKPRLRAWAVGQPLLPGSAGDRRYLARRDDDLPDG